jgi:uncharacterized SAM-dependent methyltransferase
VGVGIGDSEMALVDLRLQSGRKADVIAFDINQEFLDLFENSLKSKSQESKSYKIRYKGLRGHFEDLLQRRSWTIGRYGRRVAVCVLGGTIGNYNDTSEILARLSKFTEPGDVLLLGLQLSTHLATTFEKYKSNEYFLTLIANYLPRRTRRRIHWVLNEKETQVEAWLGTIQLFRSKKFDRKVIRNLAKSFGFAPTNNWVDSKRNVCIQTFRRI